MDEYISKEYLIAKFKKLANEYTGEKLQRGLAYATAADIVALLPSADVQTLSVVAEHIKNRLYETAYNTTEEKARNTIADMAGRIDIWIDELRDGDVE